MKETVLFVCVHNSARSQMAEALLNHLAGDRVVAESAGLEPGELNPLAVEAMKEMGIDISQKKTQDVFDLYKQGRRFNYVITVCDEANGERCPLFPGISTKLHWSFPDPSTLQGTTVEKIKKTINIRNQIKQRIEEWILVAKVS
ncbi:MAG: arsenate reductase ArsC [Bacteroidota bacterium]